MPDFIDFEWDHEDRYRSNNGTGPLEARILCCTAESITLERWDTKSRRNPKKVTRFVLPLAFFVSPQCGWKLSPGVPR